MAVPLEMRLVRISIHAPLAGRDQQHGARAAATAIFQSTRPSRGATEDFKRDGGRFYDFNPRAPRGARPKRFPLILQSTLFQSTRPSRGATLISDSDRDLGDKFQSTRPSRGATVSPSQRMRASRVFQSTRPSRGATSCLSHPAFRMRGISIHAPLAGRDLLRSAAISTGWASFQSTRPSRGATRAWKAAIDAENEFQSTRPSRGATDAVCVQQSGRRNFNPRAPRGARRVGEEEAGVRRIFQSTRPSRGATPLPCGVFDHMVFQSTRPSRGATRSRIVRSRPEGDVNPRGPRGARQQKCTNFFAHFCKKGNKF